MLIIFVCALAYQLAYFLKLAEGDATNKDELYAVAKSINWSELFSVDSTFAIDFVGTSDEIRNSQFGALTVKDAVVDHFRDLKSRTSVCR